MRITVALILLILLSSVTGCLRETGMPSVNINSINIYSIESYRDIPGITQEEISAIEALRSIRSSFSYGSVRTSEAFMLPDGTNSGFTTMLCELLSDLFGIPFVQEFPQWDSLMSGISDLTIDFTGELAATPERMQRYFMTLPLASRLLGIFMYGDPIQISDESELDHLRVAFLEDTIYAEYILNMYPHLNFETVYVRNTRQAMEDLAAGHIDVYVDKTIAAYDFIDTPLIYSKEFFPLVYTPVSLTTANPALSPVISVMNKYLEAVGTSRLYDMYMEGRNKYARFAFNYSLTDDERVYLDHLDASGAGVSVALESDNYPLSFYSDRYKKFDGVAIDILNEVSLLTGIRFNVATERNTPWTEIMEKLGGGEVSLVSELRYSEERKDNFLWADVPYAVSRYIFMSKSNFPVLEIYQLRQASVGIARNTVYDELFNRWFPDHSNIKYYDTHENAISALEKGEVDLLMESEFGLLALVNLREKPGYKANITFNSPISESFFGFNKDEELLRSIVSKAQSNIRTDRIIREWTTRVYDYERAIANQRFIFVSMLAGILLMTLISLAVLAMKNNRTKKLYKNQMNVLSSIYKSLPDLLFSKDSNGAYTSCNQAFEEFAGRPEQEILGKTAIDLYTHNTEMAKGFLEMDKQILNSQSPITKEMLLTYPDLSERLFETVYVPLLQNEKSNGFLGISRDITEHKALIDELSHAHKLSELMLDSIPLCSFLVNKEFKCFACNHEAVRLFKLSDKQEFLNSFFYLSPKYQDDGRLSLEESKAYIKRAFEEDECVFEWKYKLKDGTPIPALVTLVHVNYNNDSAIFAYVRDMREHKRMMLEIGRQKDLLETVNLVSAALLDVDFDNFKTSLLRAMSMLAKAVDADRVYIWKNYKRDSQLCCAQLYEWSDDADPKQDYILAPDISYNEDLPGWEESLSQGNCINALVRYMPQVNRKLPFLQGVLSLLVVPVFLFNEFWGFVRFDDCRMERGFTENEELILRSASRMIANALIRNEIIENLRTTASQLETVVANYPGVIWCVDKDATITLFNGMHVYKLGQIPALEGMKYYDNRHNSLFIEAIEHIHKTFSGGAQDWISKTDSNVFHLRSTPIYDENGYVTNIVGSIDDITEMIILQEELEIAVNEAQEATRAKNNSLNALESILNGIEAMIYVNVPDTGEILFINDYMKLHYNLDDSCIGQICYKVMQKGMDVRCSFCPCSQLDKEQDKVVIWEEKSEVTNQAYHNTDRYITWPDGRTVHLQYSVDITELIATRELAEQSNQAKSSFLAKMSHEIRTPMNAIVGMAELALREDMSKDAREHVFTVKQAGANLLAIINDILDFSKIETGKMEIVPADYFFSSLINDVISIIRMRLIDSQIRFAVYLDSKIPNSLFGDEIRIRQVLLNILNNAVKYTEKGFVAFSIYGEMIDQDTVNLSMEIKDSGKGIKQEDIDNLFIEYVQLDMENNKGVEGTGLGLTIAKGIATAMDGNISVQSEYGKGSSFTFTLPQKVLSPKPLATVTNHAEKNVLVYERREIYADSIVYGITNLGVNCVLVSSDSELQERLRSQDFGFIFISFALYDNNTETISKFGATAKVVVLAEFGEETAAGNLNLLSMPAHAISIANILNGLFHNYSYRDGNELIVRFTAPSTRILVVDDVKTNLKVAEGLLLPYKMQVDLCKSGQDAIEAVKNTHYDLVFMDHKMPGMDGIETTQHIREMGIDDSYYKSVPIIALTANAVSGAEVMFLQNGFNDFLSKPIDTIKLNTILEKWIPKANQKSITADIGETAEPKNQETVFNIDIDGLDVKRGISISGGKQDFYLDTLALYYKDGIEKIKELRRCLETGDLPLYTIHVHALKSASANIGAEKLSETAKALEAAGVQNDKNFIEAQNNSFLAEMELLLDNIKDALSSCSKNAGEKKEPFNTQKFKSELNKLKTAINNLDAGIINETIEVLRDLTKGEASEAIIVEMFDDILVAEYDKAIESIDALLDNANNNGTPEAG